MTLTLTPLAERIRRMSSVDDAGCWVWRGRPTNQGYGQMTVKAGSRQKASTKLAHRVSYETFVGPIADGMVIDHLCRVRLCVNPEHLEPVTASENTLRSPITVSATNAAKTHCPAGHPYPDGRRACQVCNREAVRRYKAKAKAVQAVQS